MKVPHRLELTFLALFSIIATAAGCGPGITPVSGQVLLDGKPVDGATVGFAPRDGGRPAMGTTDSAGQFRLTTFTPNDGALLGSHVVTVSKIKSTGQAAGLAGSAASGGIKIQWIVPARYADTKTSGLNVDVKRGMEPVTLELQSKETPSSGPGTPNSPRK